MHAGRLQFYDGRGDPNGRGQLNRNDVEKMQIDMREEQTSVDLAMGKLDWDQMATARSLSTSFKSYVVGHRWRLSKSGSVGIFSTPPLPSFPRRTISIGEAGKKPLTTGVIPRV